MTTATVTDSLYLKRLKDLHEKVYVENPHPMHSPTPQFTWVAGRLRFDKVMEVTDCSRNYYEEEYKGFQLIIVEHGHNWRKIYDLNGEEFPHVTWNSITPAQISKYGEMNEQRTYTAYAWKIGAPSDSIDEIHWAYQFATVQGICTSDSSAKTRKQAMRKLDTFSAVDQVRDTLISIADEQVYSNNVGNPYNACVGDQVFVQAHGRLRKGIVVETTGSRFVIGYVTPSNHQDLKIKVLPLHHLWVKP
jgi:hypothetical protein